MGRPDRSSWQAFGLVSALAVTILGSRSYAQAVPASPDVYPLYPKATAAPASAVPPETSEGGRVRNVSVPTLTVFRPIDAGTASDTAVIIAPGGGFEHLSIANEGFDVAKRLAGAGLTAIVLKYRLNPSAAPAHAAPGKSNPTRPPPSAHDVNRSPGALMAMADGEAAVLFVRAHAKALGVDPSRVGVLGFSAGGVVALHVATSPDPQTRPDFAASIYGPAPDGASPTPNAPPLFLAVAGDDKLVGPAGILPVYQAWRGAGRDVELHAYDSGGHGFGMTHQGKTSDHWIDEYIWWLGEHRLLEAAGIKGR